MALYARFIQIITLHVLLGYVAVHAEQTLTIESAVQIALERDALTSVYQSRSDAYREQSFAEDTLPDPKVKLGFLNFPTDTFARNHSKCFLVVIV